jgi:hemoglobin
MEGYYEKIGEANIRKLVNHFYEYVYDDPIIKDLFTNDIEEVREKQFLFISQFLGGPTKYSEVHGHPRMRMRHLPHKITAEAKDAWLACMKRAISHLDLEEADKETLYSLFPKLANHMVNS